MPYIKDMERELIDDSIHALIDTNRTVSGGFGVVGSAVKKGTANYIITRVVLGLLRPNSGWNYDSLADVIATLECSKMEIYRRLIGPYENKAIEKNGDLEEFINV